MHFHIVICRGLSALLPSEQSKSTSCFHTTALSLHALLIAHLVIVPVKISVTPYGLKLASLACHKKLNINECVAFCVWTFSKISFSQSENYG